MSKAEQLYKQAAKKLEVGDLQSAHKLLRQVLSRDPGSAAARYQLGVVLHKLGKPEQALDTLRDLCRSEPSFSEAHFSRATVAFDLGLLDEARGAYTIALTHRKDLPRAHHRLGVIYAAEGAFDRAERHLQTAAGAFPDDASVHLALAKVRMTLGRANGALSPLRRCIELGGGDVEVWGRFVEAVALADLDPRDAGLRQLLAGALEHPFVEPQRLFAPILRLLKKTEAFHEAVRDASYEGAGLSFSASAPVGFFGDPLVLAVLRRTVVTDRALEVLITRLRAELLRRVEGDDSPCRRAGWLPLLVACGLAAFHSEYVFAEEPEETSAVEALEARVEVSLDLGHPIEGEVALLSAWRPLNRLPFAERLIGRDWTSVALPLVESQLRAPAEEAAIASRIERLTEIGDGVSSAVRAQYEENPYPRYVVGVSPGHPETVRASLVRSLSGLDPMLAPDVERPAVLIAGCGTGRDAILASRRFANATILAVDLSRASLAYGVRLSRALGISGITFAQADLTRLGDLGRRFDVIQSSGVLHHLESPVEGWRELLRLLGEGGVMKVALYSERARQDVVACRRYIEEQGIPPTLEGIRRLRADLFALEADHPLATLTRGPEFFTASNVRDLAFHPMEHRFTPEQVGGMLDELGLQFLGFEALPRAVADAYDARFPADPTRTDLGNWDRLEEEDPWIFRSMMTFWVRRKA